MQTPLPNNRNNDQQLPRGYVNPGIYQTHDKSSFFEEKELPGSSYIPIDYWNKIMGEGRFKKVIHPLTGKVFNEGGLIDIIQADTPQKPLPAGAAQEEFERHAQHKYTEALKVLMEVNSLPGAKYPGLVGRIEDLRQQGMSSSQIINKLIKGSSHQIRFKNKCILNNCCNQTENPYLSIGNRREDFLLHS